MTTGDHGMTLDSLPATLPIFPLAGVLLLPHGQLPLNIFEPRYIAMVSAAMNGPQLIGMVQPLRPEDDGGEAPTVYSTGCAGRITGFEETDDGRFLITLTGLCRFDIVEELPLDEGGFRPVRADYARFAADLEEPAASQVNRDRLLMALDAFFKQQGYEADWETMEHASNESLITTLAMTCPFAPSEKQALLEAMGTDAQAEIVTALMEMTVLDDTRAGEGRVQ
ncbi:MAG: LON peptidase substrate-binding domain-containing protein [Pseudomonadota bacterium]|nr:LON peptidase substrate-binding domain-containing protein [Pseudomonadota bacterium]